MFEHFFPPAASQHAAAIDGLIDWVHVLMFVLFIGWGALFAYMLFRFHQSRNPKADPVGVRSHSSSWIEGGIAVVEAVLLIGFAIPLWGARVNDVPQEGEANDIRVVAQQFAWNIWYPGEDGVFGRADINLIDEATNPIGLDRSDPACKDDITTINQLHIPVNESVRIRLSSKDVIHSFNLPNMRVKQDAVPGMNIPIWFVPTITTAQMRVQTGNPEYVYEIACAQLCGNSHYSMRGFLTVHPRDEYDAWLAEQATLLVGDEEDDFWN